MCVRVSVRASQYTARREAEVVFVHLRLWVVASRCFHRRLPFCSFFFSFFFSQFQLRQELYWMFLLLFFVFFFVLRQQMVVSPFRRFARRDGSSSGTVFPAITHEIVPLFRPPLQLACFVLFFVLIDHRDELIPSVFLFFSTRRPFPGLEGWHPIMERTLHSIVHFNVTLMIVMELVIEIQCTMFVTFFWCSFSNSSILFNGLIVETNSKVRIITLDEFAYVSSLNAFHFDRMFIIFSNHPPFSP